MPNANTLASSATTSSSLTSAALVVAAHVLVVAVVSWKKRNEADAAARHHDSNVHHHHKHHIPESCGASVVVTLPEWAEEFYEDHKGIDYTSEEEMMEVAIALADKNITEHTGGPFGTAIFECDTETGICKLFSIGMNQVVSLNNSTLHGEMTAIQFGQKKLNSFTFGVNKEHGKEYHLYTSCEPCCQCLGGTLWSGVSKLVCAASKDDAEAIGFDEGPVFPKSYDALEAAGIAVVRNCLREQGAQTLKRYAETGLIYNA